MRAGKMREPVELLQPVRSVDSEGGITVSVNSLGVIRAEVREMKPAEVERIQSVDAGVEMVMVIRYRPDLAPLLGSGGNPQSAAGVIGPTWFVRWNGMDWDIATAFDPYGRRREINLYVRRRHSARAA